MRRLRSLLFWVLTWAHFVVVVPTALLLAAAFGARRIDPAMRFFCRSMVRLAGTRVRVEKADGFDAERTSFFVVNHVNQFDPFFLYTAIPQLVRGLELESHFSIPFYGWLMKRFGNVPVPDERTPSGLKRTYRLAREALDAGTSLIVFPEASRTLDGKLQPFERGAFRMAHQLGYPIVPVTMAGMFEFHSKGSFFLNPHPVTIHIHDTIDVAGMPRAELDGLADRVRGIVAGPLNTARD